MWCKRQEKFHYCFHKKTLLFRGGAGRHVHPIPGPYIGFAAQATQTSHPSGVVGAIHVGEGEHTELFIGWALSQSLRGQIRFQIAWTTSHKSRMRGTFSKGIHPSYLQPLITGGHIVAS